MGFSQSKLPIKKMAKRFGLADSTDLELGIEALQYLILHMAKVKASDEEFKLIYQSSGLNPDFYQPMFDVIYPQIGEIRDMLDKDNNKDTSKFQDLEWRLSMVTSTRCRQKVMVPKYTVKMDLAKGGETESIIFDSDYNNMKRLQTELQDALKSINGRYSKKVFKFLK